MVERSIEIDCAPMTPRPDTYIKQILEGTGIEEGKIVSKFFGNWKWDFSHVSEDKWKECEPIFQERMEKLFELGCIRYGSW